MDGCINGIPTASQVLLTVKLCWDMWQYYKEENIRIQAFVKILQNSGEGVTVHST